MKILTYAPPFLLTSLVWLGLFASAQANETQTTPVGGNIEVRTVGRVDLPPGATQSAWLDVYTHNDTYPPMRWPKSTSMIKQILGDAGWKWVDTETNATTSVSLSGYFRIFNELPGSLDTGKLGVVNVLEAGITTPDEKAQPDMRVASTASSRGLLDYDAGVAHQAGRLAGGSNAVAVGAGAAIGLDYLADVTGLRAALNNSFASGFASLFGGGTMGKPPFFCSEECQRQFNTYHHEVHLSMRFMQGTVASPYFEVIVSKVANVREDPIPLIEQAMAVMLHQLTQQKAGQE